MAHKRQPVIVIVMGVSGCGKTTIGKSLAGRLAWEFLDADDFHPPANVAKMRAGTPLDDADRVEWLASLRRAIAGRLTDGRSAVLACSALHESYRRQLRHPGEPIQLVYLQGDFATIHKRLEGRDGHYMPASLLASQFATLEEPTDALTVSVEFSVEKAVLTVVRELGLPAPAVSHERTQSAPRPDGS